MQMSIEEFCKQNKKKMRITVNKKLLKEAESMLDENEQVLYAVAFIERLKNKILVITTKRIYTCASDGVSIESEILYLKDINSIDNVKASLLVNDGGIIIRGNSQIITIRGVNIKFVVDEIRNIILKAKEDLENNSSNTNNNNLNYLEELEKLADLKEKGILSEEEFNSKKQQILNNNK